MSATAELLFMKMQIAGRLAAAHISRNDVTPNIADGLDDQDILTCCELAEKIVLTVIEQAQKEIEEATG